VKKAELEQVQERVAELVRERFPGAPIQRVELLQYGDDPKIEPGEVHGRVVLESGSGEDERKQALDSFHEEHRRALREIRRDLNRIPDLAMLEFIAGSGPSDGGVPVLNIGLGRSRGPLETTGVPLTPVMARLGPEDLETVDTLITAGISANRADAVRWALARIRERPAYEKLRERAREIEELKAQF
jgi:hypothetical protein